MEYNRVSKVNEHEDENMTSPTLEALRGIEQDRVEGIPVVKREMKNAFCDTCGNYVHVSRYDSPNYFTVYYTCFKCGAEEVHGKINSDLSSFQRGLARLEDRRTLVSGGSR